MEFKVNDLAKRIKSFGYEFGTSITAIVVSSVVEYLGSTEFTTLLVDHWGAVIGGQVIYSLVTGVVKHYRNNFVFGKAMRNAGSRTHLLREGVDYDLI